MIKIIFFKAKNNYLIKNSAVFFIGSIIASVGSYLYHLFMGRMLSVIEYGELQSLISIFMIVFLPASSLSLVAARYSAQYHNPDELGRVKNILIMFTKGSFYVGVLFFLILALFNQYIASYLRINEPIKVVIIGLVFIVLFALSLNRGVLQGLHKFKELSLVLIVETFSKLIFGVLLVWFGWDVYGALGAFVMSFVVSYIYSFYPLKKILNKATDIASIKSEELKELGIYVLPVFFSLLGVVLLISLDVILAKHYLTPQLAGSYSAISILSRAIFFATVPLVNVLFSITARQYKNGENYKKSFWISFTLIASIGFSASLVYFVLPKFVIWVLLGSKYYSIAGYLGWFAIAITLLSLVNLFTNFLLSIKMTKCVYIVLFGVLLQFIGITVWHETIGQLVFIMNMVMFAILGGLFYYYVAYHKKRKNE